MKKSHQIAAQAAKKYLSQQTGLVHYFYHAPFDSCHHTIPLYENFCYALALFHTKTQDSVEEGKKVLSRLLTFQNPEGAFPVYLHEFPQVNDHFLNAYLIEPLKKIERDYKSILGAELKDRLAEAIKKMKVQIQTQYDLIKPAGHIVSKINQALGTSYPYHEEFEQRRWHRPTSLLIGPSLKDFQEGYEPKIEVIDLEYDTPRTLSLNPHHIAASLIDDVKEMQEPKPVEQGAGWYIYQDETFAYSLLEKRELGLTQPGAHLFRLIAKGEKRLHTFVLPGVIGESMEFRVQGNVIEIDIGLKGEPGTQEIVFYHDFLPTVGNVFYKNEPHHIDLEGVKVNFSFDVVKGTGDFVGQKARGNRPAQIIKNGIAYDQMIFLRTLRRSEEATVRIKLELLRS
jgi:hypothetical protein